MLDVFSEDFDENRILNEKKGNVESNLSTACDFWKEEKIIS